MPQCKDQWFIGAAKQAGKTLYTNIIINIYIHIYIYMYYLILLLTYLLPKVDRARAYKKNPLGADWGLSPFCRVLYGPVWSCRVLVRILPVPKSSILQRKINVLQQKHQFSKWKTNDFCEIPILGGSRFRKPSNTSSRNCKFWWWKPHPLSSSTFLR